MHILTWTAGTTRENSKKKNFTEEEHDKMQQQRLKVLKAKLCKRLMLESNLSKVLSVSLYFILWVFLSFCKPKVNEKSFHKVEHQNFRLYITKFLFVVTVGLSCYNLLPSETLSTTTYNEGCKKLNKNKIRHLMFHSAAATKK